MRFRVGLVVLVGWLGASAAACSDELGTKVAADRSEAGAVYAMMVQVYDTEDRTVFVSLSDTPDIDSVDLDEAREFASVANFAAIGGKLLVSSGTEPVIDEFEITRDLDWRQRRSVSFSAYPLTDNANFYAQFVVDDEHALLPFDSTKRILWNPSEMSIDRVLDDTMLTSSEPKLVLEPGGNRNSVHYEGSVMQAFFYHDDDWYDYGAQSHLVVYDEDTFEEQSVVDIPCPGMSLATRDEKGNTYFGTWDLPSTSLLGKAPATCVAKVSPKHELIETLDLREWTDGRFANNFRYVGSGKAFANVLHHEELGVPDTTKLDDDALESLGMSGPHWKLWLFDLERNQAKPVEGIDVAVGSGFQFSVLDGRTFVFAPYDDWGRSKGYELDDDGTATEVFDTEGDVFKWVRVR